MTAGSACVAAPGWIAVYRGLLEGELQAHDIAVFVALASHANSESGQCWPSLSTIAKKAGCSKRQTQLSIDRLVADGWVKRQSRGATRQPSIYTVTMAYSAIAQDTIAPGATDYGTGCHRTTIKNNNQISSSAVRKKSAVKEKEYSTAFDGFWSVYPRKVEKRGAWAKWTATLRRGATDGELVAAAHAYAAACAADGREPRFIKHPSTFLGPAEPWREYLIGQGQPEQAGSAEKAAAALFGRD